MKDDYTVVTSVDKKHLDQLALTWPTWKRHKPSILKVPMIIFYDVRQVITEEILEIVDHPLLTTYPWPSYSMEFAGDESSKWTHPQRNRMLSGFVHIPAAYVKTPWWLKLDTDAVATGTDDWIPDDWLQGENVIIGHRWGYTKPADQMMKLDKWVEWNEHINVVFKNTSPLRLEPKPGGTRVSHPRICSWCAFFQTKFTTLASAIAGAECGPCQIPVPSQDGYMWYVATRLGLGVRRVNMKRRGWTVRASMKGLAQTVAEAMEL